MQNRHHGFKLNILYKIIFLNALTTIENANSLQVKILFIFIYILLSPASPCEEVWLVGLEDLAHKSLGQLIPRLRQPLLQRRSEHQRSTLRCCLANINFSNVKSSVPDPNPDPDLHVLGFLYPDPDPLVRGMDLDPFIIKQK